MSRIGVLIPSSNTVMERDLHHELDAVAEVHTARMYLADVTPDGEQRMLDEEVLPAARRLATIDPDFMVFGCTSADALHGAAYSARLAGQIAAITGASAVVSVLSSVIDALSGFGTVAVFTPYLPVLTDRIADRLSDAGVAVARTYSLGISVNTDIGRLTSDDVASAAAGLDLHGIDALFLSCTNLRAYDARDRIARVTARPVITSNQAVVDRVRSLLVTRVRRPPEYAEGLSPAPRP
jgi:maleate isomerase